MTTSNDESATAAASTTTADATSTMSSQDATTKKSSSTQPLHRHPSITSTTSTTNKPPPPSPALSTTSKTSIYSTRSHSNSSSCGNSTSGSSRTNNMSVDDILSNPKLSMKRRRRVRDASTSVNNSSSNSGSGLTNGGRSSTANSALQRQTTTTTTTNKLNPGQGERKKRLERLQREQLVQRRLLGEQQQQHQNSEVGRKLFQPHQDGSVEQQQRQDGGDGAAQTLMSLAAQTSTQNDQRDLPTTTTTTKRRSPRVSTTTVTTYNVSELSKNGISQEISTATTSGATEQYSTSDKNNTKAEENDEHNDDFDDMTQQNSPTTVESALKSLCSKYDSCISTDIDNSPQEHQNENEEEEKATSSTSAAVSPWSVIQVLPQVLQFINIKHHDTTTLPPSESKVDQEKQSYIQNELSKIVISVAMMKRKVMNRTYDDGLNDATNSNDDTEKAAQQQQQLAAKREAALLQMIQLQVWIRMMMWSLEGEPGWTYLEEVVKLTEGEEDGNADGDTGKRSGKKQKKKKKKGKRKQPIKDGTSTKQTTPRQALVNHLTALFELVPYVLPPSMDFSVCVKDILTFGYRQNIPEYGAEILDHFEIEMVEPITLKRSGTDTSHRSSRSEVSHSPVKKKGDANGSAGSSSRSPSRQIAERRAKRQQAYFASLMEEKAASTSTSVNADDESATITGSISTVTSTSRGSKRSRGPDIEKDDTKLLKTSVSLTAAVKPKSKENPFLKGSARGTYVGSHLGSKLANISTLFREVTVPVKKPKMKTASTASTASLLANNKRKAVPKEKKRKGDEAGPKAPFNITAKVTREQFSASEKTRIRETPTKKLRVDRTSFLPGRADTYPPLSTPRRIIEETPAKSRRVVISETPQQQPRFRRQQLDLSNATSRQQEKRVRNRHHTNNNINNDGLSPMIQYGGLSPMPQKKNVVAEAAKAAARKRK